MLEGDEQQGQSGNFDNSRNLGPAVSYPQHSYFSLPLSKMSMEESISLEETNKIRISLGLKPLTDDAAPAGDKDKEAEDNYAKQRERETKERDSKYLQGPLCILLQDPLTLFFSVERSKTG